jgi:hypothetical protein
MRESGIFCSGTRLEDDECRDADATLVSSMPAPSYDVVGVCIYLALQKLQQLVLTKYLLSSYSTLGRHNLSCGQFRLTS